MPGRRLVLLAALLAVASLLGSLPAGADTLAVTLDRIQPFDAERGVFYAARETAHDAGQPDRFKIKGDMWLANAGTADLDVAKVEVSYPGTAIPPSTDPPPTAQEVPAGGSARVRVFDGLSRELPVPLPSTVAISVQFEGTTETFDLTYPLAFYANDTATGSHLFPMAAADLEPGLLWFYGNRHVDQGSTVADRYAYDYDIRRWDGETWTKKKADENGDPLSGTSNDHFLAFGEPVYAVADGAIVVCARGVADNHPPGVIGVRGGNELYIQHGDEVVRYAHFKDGTMQPRLCPTADAKLHDVESLGITVAAGEQLGEIGNTGQSGDPHLHISVHRRAVRTLPLDFDFEDGDGHPLNHHNLRIASHGVSANALGPDPALRAMHGAIVPSETLIQPNPCGLDLPPIGAVEIARHGIPADCYQDVFNLIYDRGYRPVFVDGYDVGGETFFNAVFRPAGNLRTVARHGLTATEYDDLYADLVGNGYVLHQVDVYRYAGDVRYAAIFERRSGPPAVAFHGLTDAEYQARVEQLRNDGYAPVRVAAVEYAFVRLWTGLFEQVAVDDFEIVDVPVAQYQDAVDAQLAMGRRPTGVNGYSSLFGPRLTAVFIDHPGDTWTAAHGLDSAEYDAKHDETFAAGQLLRSVTGYEDGGARFAAVWLPRPSTTISGGPPALTTSTSATFDLGSDDPWAQFRCALNGGWLSNCATPRFYSDLPDGQHTFEASARDRDGVRDLTPAQHTWVIDTAPPTVEITRPAPGYTYAHDRPDPRSDSKIKVVGYATVTAEVVDSGSGVDTVTFTVNGVEVPDSQVSSSADGGQRSFVFRPDRKGNHAYTIRVTAQDAAGNAASDVITVSGVAMGKR